MAEFAALRPKTYSYLTDDSDEKKKEKGTKIYIIRRKLKFEDYKNCLKAAHLENKIKHLAKSKLDVVSLRENHKDS